MMIPKVIHYCWFSTDRKPRLIRKCISSWKRVMPDYEIKCWDGQALQQLIDEGKTPAIVSEALAARKWAFAADWLRLYILYNYGGIYLDSDILVYKSFDGFLKHSFFSGTDKLNEKTYEIEAAILGAVPGLPTVRKALAYYDDKHLFDDSGRLAIATAPTVLVDVFSEFGYVREYKDQFFKTDEGDFAFYAVNAFVNNMDLRIKGDKGYYARHCNTVSWCMHATALMKVRSFLLLHFPSVLWGMQRIRAFVNKNYR